MSGDLTGLERAVEIVAESRYVVAMTGAGISVESGIPTFRGEDGIWSRHGEPRADSYGAWLADPAGWWQGETQRRSEPWIVELREALRSARPNAGHGALASMERLGVVRSVITQNIDGLHQEAGSENVIEFHGSRHKMRCIDCGIRTPRKTLFFDAPPAPCAECGGRVKFDSVLFGEPIPAHTLATARIEADSADCVLVIGTSTAVKPAGGLPRIAAANGARLIEVNPSVTPLSGSCDAVIRMAAATALPHLARALSGLAASKPDPSRE
jgi:NAD-dependent deacetylase